MRSIRVLGEDDPTSIAFSLMYSLKARSLRERNQKSVKQNINTDIERQLLNIDDNLTRQRSLKRNCVSTSEEELAVFNGWLAD